MAEAKYADATYAEPNAAARAGPRSLCSEHEAGCMLARVAPLDRSNSQHATFPQDEGACEKEREKLWQSSYPNRFGVSESYEMIFKETKLPGVVVIELERRSDDRGFFSRQWCADEISRAGLNPALIQINTARSSAAGTLRGVHYQKRPHGEVKLVRCSRGAMFDVAVDLRPESPTFRQWFGIELDAESGRALYIPEGCGHGYLTLVPDTDLIYQASVPYAPASAAGVRYDDPAFGIAWPARVKVISAQDRNWPSFSEARGCT